MLIYVKFYQNFQDFLDEGATMKKVIDLDDVIGVSNTGKVDREECPMFEFHLRTRNSKLENDQGLDQIENFLDYPIFAKTQAGIQAKQFNLVSEVNALKVLQERSFRGINELTCSYSMVTNSGFALKTLDLSMNMAYVLDLTKKIE